jgi:hypothetical protein
MQAYLGRRVGEIECEVQCIMPQWLQASAMDVSKFFVQSMLLVR